MWPFPDDVLGDRRLLVSANEWASATARREAAEAAVLRMRGIAHLVAKRPPRRCG